MVFQTDERGRRYLPDKGTRSKLTRKNYDRHPIDFSISFSNLSFSGCFADDGSFWRLGWGAYRVLETSGTKGVGRRNNETKREKVEGKERKKEINERKRETVAKDRRKSESDGAVVSLFPSLTLVQQRRNF